MVAFVNKHYIHLNFSVVVFVGLVYPKLDELVGNRKTLNCEWSSVMRCIAAFVGINHASAVSFYYNCLLHHILCYLGRISNIMGP